MQEFKQAISLKNKFAPAYEGIGLVYLEQSKLEPAKKNIDKALSIDGDWIPAVVAKGRLYTAQGKLPIYATAGQCSGLPGSGIYKKRPDRAVSAVFVYRELITDIKDYRVVTGFFKPFVHVGLNLPGKQPREILNPDFVGLYRLVEH